MQGWVLPKQWERAVYAMKMNVRMAIPTIVIRMPFAKTPKGATLVPVRMVINDLNPNDKPGTVCAQINECVDLFHA
jgi:hypothetical protein